jgi:hypothetical protein
MTLAGETAPHSDAAFDGWKTSPGNVSCEKRAVDSGVLVTPVADGTRRARFGLAVDFDRRVAAGAGFLTFFAVFLGAGSTCCTGLVTGFDALRAAPPFARCFGLRARPVLDGLGSFFFRRSSISRSFFSSFLRLFSSFALFLSLLLSRFFEATASSNPP